MRQQYTEEKKQSVLKKLLPPYNMNIPELSRAEDIPTTTLYSWRAMIGHDAGNNCTNKPNRILASSKPFQFARLKTR